MNSIKTDKKLYLFNTLSKKKELFTPNDEIVKMYTCGPTVYRDAHIGNMRTYILADILKKTLKHIGYKVKHVKNITDVGHMRQEMLDQGEDKIIAAAIKEGKSASDIAEEYTKKFFIDEKALNIDKADYNPKATQHIDEMLKMIDMLIANKIAYVSNKNVYFDISKFNQYGKLSGNISNLSTLNNDEDIDPNKRNPNDFAVWKSSEENRELIWDSKFGRGFPGWHIECSAMAHKYLGEQFDIHTGGVDNIFPHHEGEIAQSEGSFGKKHVNYWIHGQHLLSEGIKMSKSKQNEYLISDISKRSIDPLAFRYLCLMTNYRTKLNFTFSSLKAAQKGLNKLRHLYWFHKNSKNKIDNTKIATWAEKIDKALLNNLNTSKVLSILWQSTKSDLNSSEICYLFEYIDYVLSLDFEKHYLNQNNFKISSNEYKDRKNNRILKKYVNSDKIRLESIKTNNLKYYDSKNGDYKVKKISYSEIINKTNSISGASEILSNLTKKNKFDISVCLILDEYLIDFERCLNSIVANIPKKLSYEIIVTVNGICDGKKKKIVENHKNNKNIKFILIDPISGAGSVRNIMLKKSLGKHIFLIDTSIEVKGDIFNQIIKYLRNAEIGLIGPYGLKTDDLHHFHEISKTKEYVDAIQLYLFAFRRDIISKTGMFRENFRFYRNLDIDFSFQIKKANLKLLSDPNLNVIRHTHSVWENTHPKTRDELSKDNYKRFLQKWKNYKHLLNKSK